MRKVSLTAIAAGVCAGALLSPVPAGADGHLRSSVHQDETLSGDTVEADTLRRDTASRERAEPVLRVSAGLSTLSGSVVDGNSSNPVTAADVTIRRINRPEADGLRTETDEHGRFRFEGIPSGEYVMNTHHIGYRDRTDTLSVGHRDLLSLDIPLTAEAVELPPLRVEVRSAWLAKTGFYWRKERGLGEFMSPEDVENRSANSFAELVRGVPGVNVIRVCDGFPCDKIIRMRHTNRARRCRVKYYMDGQPMSGRVYPSDISAHDIAAVEVYRNIAETPAQFYGQCGSVVMWSKRFDPTRRQR